MNCEDSDLAAGGLLMIPGSSQIVGGGKMGKLYLVNTTSLGGRAAQRCRSRVHGLRRARSPQRLHIRSLRRQHPHAKLISYRNDQLLRDIRYLRLLQWIHLCRRHTHRVDRIGRGGAPHRLLSFQWRHIERAGFHHTPYPAEHPRHHTLHLSQWKQRRHPVDDRRRPTPANTRLRGTHQRNPPRLRRSEPAMRCTAAPTPETSPATASNSPRPSSPTARSTSPLATT